MSRQIEPGKKLSRFERQYLRDRNIDPDEYSATAVEEYDDEETGEPEGGILSDGTNAARAGQVPTDLTGPPATSDETDPVRAQRGDSAEEDEDEAGDYSTWGAKALKAELDRRNAERDEDDQIVPEGTGTDGRLRKDDLVRALEADDNADSDDDE